MSEEESAPPTNEEASSQTDLSFPPNVSNTEALEELVQSLPDNEPSPEPESEEEPPPPPETEPEPEEPTAPKVPRVSVEITFPNGPPSEVTESQKSDAETDEFSDVSGVPDSEPGETSEEKSPDDTEEPDAAAVAEQAEGGATEEPQGEVGPDTEEHLEDAEGEPTPEAAEQQGDVEGEPPPQAEDQQGGVDGEPSPEAEEQGEAEGEETEWKDANEEPEPEPEPEEILEEWVFETTEIPKSICEPMWDYSLSVPGSMVEPQISEKYDEIKLEEAFRECRPMWDYDLSVPASLAMPQFKWAEDLRLDMSLDQYQCIPMWDYDLMAPLTRLHGIEDEIIWELSFLNFLHGQAHLVTHEKEKDQSKLEGANRKSQMVQTFLHFEPSFIIRVEDLLMEEHELLSEFINIPLPTTSYPEVSIKHLQLKDSIQGISLPQRAKSEEVERKESDESIEFWFPSFLNLFAAQEAIKAGKGPLDTEITFFIKIALEIVTAGFKADGGPALLTESALFGWYSPTPAGTVHGEATVPLDAILVCTRPLDPEELIFLSALSHALMDKVTLIVKQLSGDETPDEIYQNIKSCLEGYTDDKELLEMTDIIFKSVVEKVVNGELPADISTTIDDAMTDILSQREGAEIRGSLSTMLAQSLFVKALVMSKPEETGTTDMSLQLKLTIDKNIADMLALKQESEITSDQLPADVKTALENTLASIIMARLQGQVESDNAPVPLQPVIEEGVAEAVTGTGISPDLVGVLKTILESNAVIIILRGRLPTGNRDQVTKPRERSLSVEVKITPPESAEEIEEMDTEDYDAYHEVVEETLLEAENLVEEHEHEMAEKEEEGVGEEAEGVEVEVDKGSEIEVEEGMDEVTEVEADEGAEIDIEEGIETEIEEGAEIEIVEGAETGIEEEAEIEIEEGAEVEIEVSVEGTGPEDEFEDLPEINEDEVDIALEIVPSATESFQSAEGDTFRGDEEFYDAQDTFATEILEEIIQESEDIADTQEEEPHEVEGQINEEESETEMHEEIHPQPAHRVPMVKLEFEPDPLIQPVSYDIQKAPVSLPSPWPRVKGGKEAITDEALKQFRIKFAQEIAPVREKLRELQEKVIALDIPAFSGLSTLDPIVPLPSDNYPQKDVSSHRPICKCKKSLPSKSRH